MLQLPPPPNLHSGLFHICRSGKSKRLGHHAVVGSNLSLPTYQLCDPEQVFYLLSLAVLLSSFEGLLWGLSEVTWRGTSLPGTGWAPNNCQVGAQRNPSTDSGDHRPSWQSPAWKLKWLYLQQPPLPLADLYVCFCFSSFSQLPPLLTAAVFPSPHPPISHKTTL